MKKFFVLFVLVGFSLTIGLSLFSSKVIAAGIANGTWSTGREIGIDVAYDAELQSFGKGVVVTAPTEICHEFSGGQFGWQAVIRRLVNNEWVNVPTTQGWVPNTEGNYMACAQAPSAGKYALFAYYVQPENAVQADEAPAGLPACQGVTIEGGVSNYSKANEAVIRLETFSGITPGETWTFEILSIKDQDDIDVIVDTYTNDLVYDGDNMMYEKLLSVSAEVRTLNLRVNTPSCYVDLTFLGFVD